MNIEAIDQYLGMGKSLEEEALRHTLTIEGPSLIEPVIQRTLFKIRRWRYDLDDLFAGQWATMAIRQIFERATDLILEIIKTVPQGGEAVAQELLSLFEHEDAGMRALAAVFTGLQGIPTALTTGSLRKRFQADNDLVVKMAAAIHLQGNLEKVVTLPPGEQKSIRLFITAYTELARQEPGSVSIPQRMLEKIAEDLAEDRHSEKALMMGVIDMMRILPEMPVMVALQGDDY